MRIGVACGPGLMLLTSQVRADTLIPAGNLLDRIELMTRVSFVMKDGEVVLQP
ncbi:MAG: hypothetical protein MUP90_11410 [Gammaproteobacteria bacterium]|nr:hypothetical protein [Gammaproteobacteria bacterium]